jgi:hypothetical protein
MRAGLAHSGAFGMGGAGVGISFRIPATLIVTAILTKRGELVASLNVGGIESLAVKLNATASDLIVHSFAEDDPIVCKEFAREKCGLLPFKPNGKRRQRASSAEIDALLQQTIASQRQEHPRGQLVGARLGATGLAALAWRSSRAPARPSCGQRPTETQASQSANVTSNLATANGRACCGGRMITIEIFNCGSQPPPTFIDARLGVLRTDTRHESLDGWLTAIASRQFRTHSTRPSADRNYGGAGHWRAPKSRSKG